MSDAVLAAPRAGDGRRIIDGPERVRSENWWRVELADGRRGVLAQLLPELARDEALRRRYVFDAERRAGLDIPGVAPVIEIGPQPDPRDPDADPPWRLRADPAGEPLSAILERRAPMPSDEAIELVAGLASVIHECHRRGLVLRDLDPRNVVVSFDGEPRLWLTDIGFARVDILSSRTASSLMLEGSPYAAPEHLRATVLDSRADIYTLGVILWQALTGELPFADTLAFIREVASLPSLASLGIHVPDGVDALITACLEEDPERRPESAADIVDALRGSVNPTALVSGSVALVPTVCQSCGNKLRPGLRLCLSCGKQAVQFSHASSSDDVRYEVRLLRATEDAEFVAKLRSFFEAVGHGPVPELNFLIGDVRMYSRAEKEQLHKLPAVLLDNLDEATAKQLAKRLGDDGFRVKVARMVTADSPKKPVAPYLVGGAFGLIGGFVLLGAGILAVGVPLLIGGGAAATFGLVRAVRSVSGKRKPLAGLRQAPAALPASDPLVARLGGLLGAEHAADVRERIEEIALLVQRLVDHRAVELNAAELDAAELDAADFERLTEPVEPIVALVEREVAAIADCDLLLVDLDEGALVRAIAKSEARGEPRNLRVELYTGLDRLRELEEQRARHMRRLLEASSLMRRTASMGLGARGEQAASARLTSMALAALDE